MTTTPLAFYRHYLVLHIRSTKLYSIEEIVQIGAVIVNAGNFELEGAFETLVRPSILSDISPATRQKFGFCYEELDIDFTHVLKWLLNDLAWALGGGGGGILIVTLGTREMYNLLCGQLAIEQAMGKMTSFPQPERLHMFESYCNLEAVFSQTNHFGATCKSGRRSGGDSLAFLYAHFKLEYGEAERAPRRAIDRAMALVPIMKLLVQRYLYNRPLFPTSQLPNLSNLVRRQELLPPAAGSDAAQLSTCDETVNNTLIT